MTSGTPALRVFTPLVWHPVRGEPAHVAHAATEHSGATLCGIAVSTLVEFRDCNFDALSDGVRCSDCEIVAATQSE